ncbi:unnamed protein product, partial [marine sediment metagenome]
MKKLSLGLICLLLAVPCGARTITVDDDGPADFNNIQAAINDANDGDTVIVADGIYTGTGNRDIDFLGKAITVKSKNGAANCIIDCHADSNDPHQAFIFQSGEKPDSVLAGFTVTGSFSEEVITCYKNCSPRIVNCLFRD